jgi:hypothetical protein
VDDGGRQELVPAREQQTAGETSSDSDVEYQYDVRAEDMDLADDGIVVTERPRLGKRYGGLFRVMAHGVLQFSHGGKKQYVTVGARHAGKLVRAFADFGRNKVIIEDPESDERIGEWDLPRQWRLDENNEQFVDIAPRAGVRIGTMSVAIAARGATRALLRGHPPADATATTGTINVYVLDKKGTPSKTSAASVTVAWTPRARPADAGSAAAPVPAQRQQARSASGESSEDEPLATVVARLAPPPLRPHQARWLAHNRRRTAWVEQDRDSLAAAAVATNGPALVAEAMRLVADAAGMRQTLGTRPVTGRDLRMFLADLIESVVTAPRRDEGLFQDLRLSNFPIEAPPGGHRPSMAQMVAALRRLGEHPEVFDHWLPYLLHHFFEKARALSQDTLDVGFAWLFELPGLDVPAGEVWLGPLDAEREVQQVVVQVGPYYLPTAPVGRPPHGAVAV